MSFYLWCVVIGLVFIVMALSTSLLKRLPITSSIIYLLVGLAIGPLGLALLTIKPLEYVEFLERFSEVVVLISLFTAGLKLRLPLRNNRWRLPLRLASIAMIVTITLIALVGVFWLNLPLGAAILLGAVLAPTDPVLASDVQVEEPTDSDHVRFGLTGEAGLNDGTAFPFIMLGLGLMGHHELGAGGWRWIAVDVVWAIVGGIAIGALLGTLTGRVVLYLRKNHAEALGLDNFLAMGLIALSYGVALLSVTYGFLAVFAAGLALRRIELTHSGDDEALPEIEHNHLDEEATKKVATDPEKASAYLMHELLAFNEQAERIAEVAMVLIVGGLLAFMQFEWHMLGFALLLFVIIRPIAVFIGLIGTKEIAPFQRRFIGWFGVRGIGSVYYLMYALNHGVKDDGEIAQYLLGLTFTTIVASIFIHGISVTPLMNFYSRRTEAVAA